RRIHKPEQGKQPYAHRVVGVKQQIAERPEARRANRHLARCSRDARQPCAAARLPENDSDECPNKCRQEKRPRLWEKRLKHNASFLLLWLLLCTTRYHTKNLPKPASRPGQKGQTRGLIISSLSSF